MASLLPHDIIVDILTRLPVKSLLRFRCVNKSWCDLFRNPSFVKMHHKLASENNDNITVMVKDFCNIWSISLDDEEVVRFDYPFSSSRHEVRYLGYYNGLICIRIEIPVETIKKEIIYLWNPSTKEFKELPDPVIEFPQGYDYYIYGFGYDSSIEDYKVVKIAYTFYDNGSYCSEVLVYTLGSDSWRRIGDIPYVPTYYRLPGTHVNGALHWVVDRDCNSEISDKLILSLDLANEGYLEVPQPDYLDNGFDIYICELEGCLCVLCNFGDLRLDAWVMKDYGVKGSWSKIFTISQQLAIHNFHTSRPMKIFKNGEILMKNGCLVAFDPKNNTVRELAIYWCEWYDAVVYVGSLNSLNSGTYVETSGGAMLYDIWTAPVLSEDLRHWETKPIPPMTGSPPDFIQLEALQTRHVDEWKHLYLDTLRALHQSHLLHADRLRRFMRERNVHGASSSYNPVQDSQSEFGGGSQASHQTPSST